MPTYGIIGKGAVSEAALKAALDDLSKDAAFYVHKDGKVTDSLTALFTWLIDWEREFHVLGNSIGVSLSEYAKSTSDGTMEDVINKSDTILVLWDDSESLEKGIMYAASSGKKILELSNGLAPIEVEDDTAAPVVAQQPELEVQNDEQEEEAQVFSRAEMEAMPAAAVKRYATNSGVDIKGKTKAEIIDEVMGGTPAPVVEQKAEEGNAGQQLEPLTKASIANAVGAMSLIFILDNGTSITVHTDRETMNRVMSVL